MTTPQPSSSSELQLYRVLQRSNLLQYYDTFISQGGDDVQQLCEAGEEEFLEIMALVGMASKPLHVRRLQKALQEWATNPSLFNQALANSQVAASPGSITANVAKSSQSQNSNDSSPSPSMSAFISNIVTATGTWKPKSSAEVLSIPSPASRELDESHSQDRKSPVAMPVLLEDQIAMIALSAERLCPSLSYFEPKPMNMKKEINREIDFVINMGSEGENRMDLIRKYSAIYGRFDSKRKGEKPMSMHEISVNEAAAQICRHVPALLTRRDELFPLARQVVRESGYQYSKGHSRAQSEMGSSAKKMKLDLSDQESNGGDFDQEKMEEREKEIGHALQQIAEIQSQIKEKIEEAKTHEDYPLIHELQSSLEECASEQLKLLTEQAEIKRKEKKSQKKSLDFNGLGEDNDSANYSNASSPREEKPDLVNIPTKRNVQETRQFVQETLFDEGLRIAQQYGMADFAEELTGLKPQFVKKAKTAEDGDNAETEHTNGDAAVVETEEKTAVAETEEKTEENGS